MGGQIGTSKYVAMRQNPPSCDDLVIAGSAGTPPPPVDLRLDLKCHSALGDRHTSNVRPLDLTSPLLARHFFF